ncbi:MAG TPA: DUF4214 domain-containing protein [Pirellulales bacterium]|nr:DUF4214 domain-containing protein [Pirellulales bacterium]
MLSAVTWSVFTDTTGSSPGNPYSLRGLALSPNDASIYAGYIHSSAINELSTSTASTEATVSTPGQQPKGVATDDRGFVYSTLNTGSAATTQPWTIYNSNLTPVSGAPFTSATTAAKQLSGIAVQKLNGHYFVYISSNKGAGTIERWNVDNPSAPVLDTSFGSNGIANLQSSSFGLGANAFVNGLVVDADGTIYATGGVNTTDRGDAVFKISPNGTSLEAQASVNGAMDDALFDGRLFVTEYLGPNSAIAVLNDSNMSLVDTITDSPKGAYANTTPDAQGYDAGYSGIDISASGQIYVAEQLYTYNNDNIFHDRILVSSALAAPSVTSPATATFTPNTTGTFTVTTTGSPTPTLTETGALPNGLSFTDNGNGTATLTGSPAGGTYHFTINATSYLGTTSQPFTLTVQLAPTITGANNATFTAGAPGTFTVTTTGAPAAALTESGALPSGVHFVDNGNGTATLSGIAAIGSQGTYPIKITANNGVSPNFVQNFTLTVLPSAIPLGFYLAGVPGDTTATTFVHNLYRELLGREPDAGGLTFYTNLLVRHQNTALERAQVISAFLNSPEYKTHYVTVLYETLLDRVPENNGLVFWADKMGSPGTIGGHGGSADEKYVFAAILGSDEFYLKAGDTPQGFVNALYKDLLNRAPDSGGLAFWSGLVGSEAGNRDGVVREFISSDEFNHLVLNNFYPATGGTASTPLPAPGTPVSGGSPDLAVITSDGWENLYLEGPFGNSPQGNDIFFTALSEGASWDDIQLAMLNTPQYYTNPNRPVTS